MKTDETLTGGHFLGIRDEAKVETHFNLLYEWVEIVRKLYPKERTRNPEYYEFEHIWRRLEMRDALLLHALVDCFTRLHLINREQVEGEWISTHEDNVNAFQLLLPKELQVTKEHLRIYTKLNEAFGYEPFVKAEAMHLLGMSHATFKRKMRALILYEMMKSLPWDRKGKKQYRLLEIKGGDNPEKDDRSAFDQANEDWEDFEGFVEL